MWKISSSKEFLYFRYPTRNLGVYKSKARYAQLCKKHMEGQHKIALISRQLVAKFRTNSMNYLVGLHQQSFHCLSPKARAAFLSRFCIELLSKVHFSTSTFSFLTKKYLDSNTCLGQNNLGFSGLSNLKGTQFSRIYGSRQTVKCFLF